jgi:parallel beta-helix repeat protein
MNDLVFNRKVFAAFLVSVFVVSALLIAVPVRANPGVLYVDDDGICDGNTPCYLHPQDAVNNANPGDTIRVYPGTYGHRVYTSPKPPHWGPSDQYAPSLIVYKDGLTIEAVDPDPANTVIQTTYNFWVNKALPSGGGGGSIEHSTGCIWNPTTKVWDDDPATPGDCVRPTFGTAPNAIAVIASNVIIRGFTLHRPYDWTSGTYNTAGVMIGGLYAGDPDHLGSDGNTIENCVFSDVWHAVYIWHSSGNTIIHNNVAALSTNHWAAISVYDGDTDAKIQLGNLSQYNEIAYNTLANRGIAVGAWAPSIWTDNTGTSIHDNTATWVGITYSSGPKYLCSNTLSGGYWFDHESGHSLCISDATASLWLNLANTDDVGTYFDVKVELLKGGNVVGSGILCCLKPARVSKTPVSIHLVVTDPAYLASGETFSLKVSVRIGAEPSCAGKGHKDGTLQLQYDSKTRKSNVYADFGAGDTATGTYYLHQGNVMDTNAPTLKKVSTINRHPDRTKSGNPWIELGTWTSSPLP